MEKDIQQLVDLLNEMNTHIDERLAILESRLAKFEKVDSIEHRVTVNQIDITDIKELLQKLEGNPTESFVGVMEGAIQRFESTYQTHLELMNRRLDSQLLMIAKNEEEINILKQQQGKTDSN